MCNNKNTVAMVFMNFSHVFNVSRYLQSTDLRRNFLLRVSSHCSLYSSWPWLLSVPLLCFTAYLKFSELPVLRQKNGKLADQINAQASTMLRNKISPDRISPRPLAAQLPPFERLSQVTRDLHALAEENGLTISDATFKPAGKNGDDHIQKMEMGLRLKGGYLPLKNALAALLAKHDGLALEFLSVQRSRATDLVADAEVRLGFYQRTAHITELNRSHLAQSDLERDPLLIAHSDPFKAVNFVPPVLPTLATTSPPVPIAPPAPRAPTFPYRYFGSMVDIDGKKIIYLQKGDAHADSAISAITEQQILDGVYRVDSIAATQIVISYIPLEQKNIVAIQTAEN